MRSSRESRITLVRRAPSFPFPPSRRKPPRPAASPRTPRTRLFSRPVSSLSRTTHGLPSFATRLGSPSRSTREACARARSMSIAATRATRSAPSRGSSEHPPAANDGGAEVVVVVEATSKPTSASRVPLTSTREACEVSVFTATSMGSSRPASARDRTTAPSATSSAVKLAGGATRRANPSPAASLRGPSSFGILRASLAFAANARAASRLAGVASSGGEPGEGSGARAPPSPREKPTSTTRASAARQSTRVASSGSREGSRRVARSSTAARKRASRRARRSASAESARARRASARATSANAEATTASATSVSHLVVSGATASPTTRAAISEKAYAPSAADATCDASRVHISACATPARPGVGRDARRHAEKTPKAAKLRRHIV